MLTCTCSLHKDSADAELKEFLRDQYQKKSRDNARTPMQWDDSPNAGFTTGGSPWMRVNDNYKEINAASQVSDPDSIYSLWRQVLQKRKEHKDIFVYGDFKLVDEPNDKIFAYTRVAANGDTALMVCNYSTETVAWKHDFKAREVLVTPGGKTLDNVNAGQVELRPYEAVALLL